jgi:hypothetical protein
MLTFRLMESVPNKRMPFGLVHLSPPAQRTDKNGGENYKIPNLRHSLKDAILGISENLICVVEMFEVRN